MRIAYLIDDNEKNYMLLIYLYFIYMFDLIAAVCCPGLVDCIDMFRQCASFIAEREEV